MAGARDGAALAERVARESYGRLLAALAARTRDVAAAEDALAEAFAAALRAWPASGAPDNPEAWLFAAAKRKLIDFARRAHTASQAQDALAIAAEELDEEMRADALPDRRLGLLFACAHPAVDEGARTALMLQTILGLSAERIAAAFLVEPAAMSQRLVRAKKRIRDAGVPFDVPDPSVWPERLQAVLEAIYAAYTEGWSDALGADSHRRGLSEEAVWLARVLAAHTPDEPETLGLLALFLHLEARRPARRDAEGRYVALDQQDVGLWRDEMIAEAERTLFAAAKLQRAGRFQLEAAIQSAHARRRFDGVTDWNAICLLYAALVDLCASPAARLNQCAALARRDGAQAGLDLLCDYADAHPELGSYQPFWALRADLCARLDRRAEARAAYDQAMARERDPAVVVFLQKKRDALS
ncbi:MAG: RNA polymerase subunit sigma-70 [Alphaproteobacteria bacterium]|nr:RNA polymerase subunit sigma-70 [Alphaproteobacteria bacterium]